MNKRTITDILEILKTEEIKIVGSNKNIFDTISSIEESEKGSLTFCTKTGEEGFNLIRNTKASIIITHHEYLDINEKEKTLIIVKNPRLSFIKCYNEFFPEENLMGIHPTAVIGEKCTIGTNVYIGPFSVVSNDVVIGNETIIESNVYLHSRTKIGKKNILYSGSVIGSKALAYEKNNRGVFESFPQHGGVSIGDYVEIGANTVIMRGTFKDTEIGSGSKIGCLVSIGHNVKIGKNCMVINFSCIQGSAIIEDDVWLAAHSCIKNGVRVGKGSTVGMGAVVIKDVPQDVIVVGVPAKPISSR